MVSVHVARGGITVGTAYSDPSGLSSSLLRGLVHMAQGGISKLEPITVTAILGYEDKYREDDLIWLQGHQKTLFLREQEKEYILPDELV